jgi:ABC-type glycerol-3-phosphate transport system permease component
VNPLLKDIRHNPLLWLLAFVPVLFAVQKLKAEAHTLLFVLSVLDVVPLAALLSHATESVAAKTGDTVGGLLNNHWALILAMVTIASAYAIWVLKQASDTLPVELDEAATMDGATTLQLCRLVYVPLMMPSLCRRIPTSRFPSRSATFSPPTTHHGNC